ncbi:MAG: translocation/assembly module TamB domain-containing protein [candidate division Zixibacteria bacterium]|nr:translocation/assembly module TamB domain-containing protein [candidate division Zixibacteria bacterium]
MRRSSLKWVGAALGLVMILAVAAMIAVTVPPGENVVRGWLEGKLTSVTGLPVTIGTFETNLFSRVYIEDLVVGSDSPANGGVHLHLHHLRLDYSLRDLVGDEITLRAVTIDTVGLAMARDSLGRFGWGLLDSPATAPVDTATTESSFGVGRVSVDCFDIAYADAVFALRTELGGGAIKISRHGKTGYAIDISVDRLKAGVDSLVADGENIRISAAWDEGGLTVESLDGRIEGLDLAASGRLTGADYAFSETSVSVAGPLDRLLADMAPLLPEIETEGTVEITADIEGTVSAPSVAARVELPLLALEGVRLARTMLVLAYSPDGLSVDSLLVLCCGGTITGHGRVAMDSTYATDAELLFKNINLAALWSIAFTDTALCEGVLGGSVVVSGAGTELAGWRVAGDVVAEQMRYEKRALPDFRLNLGVADGLGEFALRQADISVTARVRSVGDSIEGSFRAAVPEAAPLAAFFDQPELSGHLQAAGTITGQQSNPTVRARLSGGGLQYQNFPIDSLSANLRFEDSALFIEEAYAAGRRDSVDPGRSFFHLDSIGGGLSYSVTAAGPLDSLSGGVMASLTAPAYKAYSADSVDLQVVFDGSRIELREGVMFRESLRLRLSGAWDTTTSQGVLEASLMSMAPPSSPDDSASRQRVEWVQAGELGASLSLLPDSTVRCQVEGRGWQLGVLVPVLNDTLRLAGTADFDVAFEGNPARPQARLEASVRSLRTAEVTIDSVTISGVLADREVSLDEVSLFAIGQKLSARARLELSANPDSLFILSGGNRVAGALTVADFDLSAATPFLESGASLAGRASAEMTWDGTVASPHVSGWLSLAEGRYQATPEAVAVTDGRARMTVEDTLLTIDSAGARVGDMPVSVAGTVVISEWKRLRPALEAGVSDFGTLAVAGEISEEELDLRISTVGLELSVLSPFVPSIDSLSGTVDCELDIRGPSAAPQMQGTLQLSALVAEAPKKYITVRDGGGLISFDRNRIGVASLVATVNGGTVHVSGHITHEMGAVSDIDLSVSGGRMSISIPDTAIVNVDTMQLRYARQNEYYILEGDIQLGESRLIARFRPQTILPWARAIETVDLELPEMLEQTRLDVRVRESDQLWVDNNLARIRLHSELGIIGTPVQPNLTGKIEIEEGYLLYLDRKFKVTRGSVYFIDPNRFNPDVALTASTQVSSYQRMAAIKYVITFDAEGPLDQLRVGLFSEPPLDQSDIVAVLTVGATRSQLAGKEAEGGQGGTKNVLLERAKMLSSQRVSGYVSDKVGAFFGFDEFTVEGNLFQFDKSWGPQLLASRKLSERMELTYTTTVGHMNDQSVRLGYRLTKRVFLQGQTDRRGRALFDLKYGIRFR